MAKSFTKVKHRRASTATSKLEWLSHLLILCDNEVAEHIVTNLVFYERTKHLNIDCHYLTDKIMEGFLQIRYVSSKEQLIDLLTKPLNET